MPILEIFNVVALLRDLPQEGLVRGQVGTVVELLSPTAALVEFADNDGCTYAMPTVTDSDLIRLHYQPSERAA
jgi:hypothetical protein